LTDETHAPKKQAMGNSVRFAHVNLVARDWKRLAAFYERVFECTPVPPQRELAGRWLDDATSLADAQIRGMHLRLPGYGASGPTLEIFEYRPSRPVLRAATNRPGFAHIAFAVADVQAARDAVLAAGGGGVGELVTVDIPEAGRITFAYVTDPEGNVIELQKWSQ
jgi:predicted enzyme related to lactoylglutathione lyase